MAASHTITPIGRSIAALRKQLSDAEWNGQPTTHLAVRLAVLEAAKARGEEWDVPF